MRALFVAPYLPTPGSGGRTRLISVMERTARAHEVAIVAFPAPDQERTTAPYAGIAVEPPPVRRRRMGPLGAIGFYRDRLTPLPSFVAWMRSPRMRAAVRAAVERFRPDVVQVCTTEMGQYLGDVPSGPARVLDLQDVASRWFGRTVRAAHLGPHQRALLRLELAKTRRYESRAARLPDAVLVTSPEERSFLRDLAGVDAVEVPNGVDTAAFAPPRGVAEAPGRLLFVGPLTYDANIDGLRWFCDEVLPLVRESEPGVEVEAVGTPGELTPPDGVRLAGRVDDVRPHLAAAPVSIVPVRLGSGTRYKILEALSMERAVVSTSVGAEGLGLESGRHLLVADEPAAFARACVDLLRDAAARARLGAAGRAHVAARYDWGPLVARVEEVWDAVVAGRRASTSQE